MENTLTNELHMKRLKTITITLIIKTLYAWQKIPSWYIAVSAVKKIKTRRFWLNKPRWNFFHEKRYQHFPRVERVKKKGHRLPLSSPPVTASSITFVEFIFSFLDPCLGSYILNLKVYPWSLLSRLYLSKTTSFPGFRLLLVHRETSSRKPLNEVKNRSARPVLFLTSFLLCSCILPQYHDIQHIC